VQTGQDGQYVFVVKPDSKVEQRPITVGERAQTDTVITKGLQPGETVVTEGQLRLEQGTRIQTREGGPAGGPGGGRGQGGQGGERRQRGQGGQGQGGQGGGQGQGAAPGGAAGQAPAAPQSQPNAPSGSQPPAQGEGRRARPTT
jgi:multidrug efflux system membrane fusion protein